MKPIDSSLSASIFSLGKGGHSAAGLSLPPDALVIVIQDCSETLESLPLFQRHNCHRSGCESLPVIRRKAEKAYSKQRKIGAANINVSG